MFVVVINFKCCRQIDCICDQVTVKVNTNANKNIIAVIKYG